jgi:23S rRNA (cytidine1920-2'-O)/16S rRNA (cytidine1409-2'-O)-methyltransferase
MAGRRRLDAELVRRGLARSREHAADLVTAGRVQVSGRPSVKPATAVEASVGIVVQGEPGDDYVSRGAHKLAGALDAFGCPSDISDGGSHPDGSRDRDIAVLGRRCLDAGASTGGFTDVLLRRGAAAVVAVDVGYGQLDWRLRSDPRVAVLDRTNVRSLTPELIAGVVDLTVADLSFISLRLVLDALTACTRDDGDLLLMVKPQFEVGRDNLGAGGVVRDPGLRSSAVRDVAAVAYERGWGVAGVTASPLPGPSGNVEYFVWLRRDATALDEDDLQHAVEEGPT